MTEPMQSPTEDDERFAGAFLRAIADAMDVSLGTVTIAATSEHVRFLHLAATRLDPPPDDPKFLNALHRHVQSLDQKIRDDALEEGARLCDLEAADPQSCDKCHNYGPIECARNIRSLKRKDMQ